MPAHKSTKKPPTTRYELAKTDWLTPDQRDVVILQTWKKLQAEELDFEAIKAAPDITYFNRPFAVPPNRSEYDHLFNFDESFDCKKAKEDSRNLNLIRENIYKEESERKVPVTSSQVYGHRREDIEGHPVATHKRTRIMDECFHRWGLNFKRTKKFPLEFGYPSL